MQQSSQPSLELEADHSLERNERLALVVLKGIPASASKQTNTHTHTASLFHLVSRIPACVTRYSEFASPLTHLYKACPSPLPLTSEPPLLTFN